MTHRRVEILLWAVALALAALAGVRARLERFLVLTRSADSLVAPGPPSPHRESAATLASAAELLVARDVFRLERRPSGVAYSPTVEGSPPPPRPARPSLAVAGIVGGPPWEALLEGVPGRHGSVLVRRDDTLGSLRVRAITRDTVRITGMDTTWILTVRRPWQ